ncbi:MAG: hypothetical protein KatS3mg001_370 [Candidatus Pacearchaeota archaeon]|nr:MAG: hypothetical protein KatS3mg001_370 [Candidatus Pacearchaeota archaeon]
MPKDIKEILEKYGKKIEERVLTETKTDFESNYSQEYLTFKKEMSPEISRYERLCKSLGSLIKLNVSKKDEEKIRKYLEIAHLDLEPWQPLTLSVVSFLSIFFIAVFLSVAIFLISGSFPFLFFFLISILSIFVFYFTKEYPARIANKWRLKASSQMVPAILYVVVYMRHTSNLERAIAFAAENLQPPLSLDLKKVFYDVQLGKFPTIKDSLNHYLDTWRDYSPEFIEAFHLIESSLFEPDNSRRITILEKSLNVVLDGVYDKMLNYTHNVKSPLTNVYMLGVILPTLGLALLPLASAMLGGLINWLHVFILFNLIIPFFVFYLTDKVIFLRPGGYGETSLLEKNPLYYKYKDKRPYFYAFIIALPFFVLGFLPFIFQFTSFPEFLGLKKDYNFSELGLGFLGNEKFFGFENTSAGVKGPFGIGALFLSMLLPLGLALFFYISFNSRTKELIEERKNTKQLEEEFNNSLFQVGNRLGNGVPVELVFGKVSEATKGLKTSDFFARVDYNIKQLGMSVEKAIFDPKRGAIIFYPSELISTSMKILIESSKKGLQVAAISMMSISEYVKNIKKINNRLKDMLAEVVSDMKSNMSFLAPLLSGVVVGLAAMIVAILTKLNIDKLAQEGVGNLGNLGAIIQIFKVNQMIPPYFLQLIIGIYLIQIIFILTRTLVVIDSGEDKLETTDKTGKNIFRGVSFYFLIAFFSTLVLFILTTIVIGTIF